MYKLKRFLGSMLMATLVSLALTSCDQMNAAAQQVKQHLRSTVKGMATAANQKKVPLIPMVPGVSVIRDLKYGPHQKQGLDVYVPEGAGNAPIIMNLRGGGWAGGDKENQLSYINKVNRWVPKGFVVISVDTRVLPQADAYQQVDDLAQAVVYVQQHATEWGGDSERLMLMGHSSAGTMVTVLAANPAIVIKNGGKRWLASIALDSSSLDIPRAMRLWAPAFIARAYGKDPKRWLDASPVHLLNDASIPMLLACSTQRGDAPCEQAALFAEEAKKFSIITKVVPQDYNHGGVDFNLGVDLAYTQAVESFMAGLDSDVAKLLHSTGEH